MPWALWDTKLSSAHFLQNNIGFFSIFPCSTAGRKYYFDRSDEEEEEEEKEGRGATQSSNSRDRNSSQMKEDDGEDGPFETSS